MRTSRPTRAALITAGLLVAVAGCGSGSSTPAAAPPAPTLDAAAATSAVCSNLLKIDAVPSPESGPEGPAPVEAVKEFGAAVAPLLDAATEQAPPALLPSLTAMRPVVTAAQTQGVEPDFEDPAFSGAVAGYETWAHANCGYQKVALTGTDFEFAGAPATLESGPVSILLTNETADEQFHVAVLAKAKDDSVTLDRFLATPFEGLMEIVDLVPGGAAAAPGQTGGILVDLEPGRYFLLCPVGDEGELPHHLQGIITEVTVT